jgi:hypothetical protein
MMPRSVRLEDCVCFETHESSLANDSDFMLLIIAILLLLFWGGGFAFHVAGGLIHLLLVIALVMFILHFVRGGKGV